MKRVWFAGLAVLCLIAFAGRAVLAEDEEDVTLRATLRGANEVPPNSTAGTGSFKATIHTNGSIDFTFTFADLSAIPTVAHIHFGQFNVSGGVMIFLCGGGSQPSCPAATSGTIVGTIAAANVVGPIPQGVTAGDLAAALRAIAQGEGYVNIHNARFPAGEIRGQVRARNDD
jgi:CHRD domain-containing protein